MTLRQAMILGTAGFTAMLCVNALIRQGMTSDKKVVVTGASGGVGSTAIALLHKLDSSQSLPFPEKKSLSHG